MDKIIIKDLVVFAKHGVFPEENKLGQKFLVTLILECDLRKAGLTDELDYSVSYADIAKETTNFLTENTFQLLETCAEKLAHHLLIMYPVIKAIQVDLKKPWAPIGLDVDTVMVSIKRAWHQAYIALGSNMGDKETYLNEAVQILSNHPDCRVLKVSPFITTPPYGEVEQDDFLNGVLLLETLLMPLELLDLLQALEKQAKRERKIHWGPRTLDLDILFFDDLIINDERLIVHHPDLTNRSFVLEPLNAIAPYLVHPRFKLTVQELLKKLNG